MQVELALEELETLASALVRLKFEDEEPPEPYFGSPRLAAAHRRIVDSIILESERIGDSRRVARWESWRKWSTREYERGVIARYASSLEVWDEWGVSQKIEVLKTCSAPFEPNEEELEELRNEIDVRRYSSSSDGPSRGA
ncbi:hypothetical protein SSP531S_47430 [Streptomyces spongiicola]|uniref:Uncharacterized protein n=1 Tax=Streptomyces spongiicola TaxID=1690221 RepID=A0A388T2W8_9ACTN|nr:hypothetical protein [Streptomyces spongiicola]GBQ03273.1 hypothetical protein SSP531S_47430 [Streptomyces spongiicola]